MGSSRLDGARALASRSAAGPGTAHRHPKLRRRPLVTRRVLQLALGVLWLLDGALQLQPFMFTRGFADQVISPSASGQPGFVAGAVHWSATLIAGHPVGFDVLFAAVQLAIGLAFLYRRTVRPAIVASVGWALGVWVFGEGAGGLAGGSATFLTGAPGAVILYAVIGLAAWPRLAAGARAAFAAPSAEPATRLAALLSPADDERPAAWVPGVWVGLWALFALLRALPANDSAGALAAQLRANVSPAPSWLARGEHALGSAAGHQGLGLVVVVVAVELAVGLMALWPGIPRRLGAGTGIGLALAAWILGQAFGQIPSGMATDPNTGPLVALLGIALWGCNGAGAMAISPAHEDRTPQLAGRPEAA